ncbi:MAG: hypothetical protein KW793_03820 [Candidatus Doudnabacteria bacterium]|nr:hypothetical protein [Candidatus Doudnabacteria bacterium]
MKPKNILALLVVMLGVVAFIYFGMGKKNDSVEKESSQTKKTDSQQKAEVTEVPNALEGELKQSNDKRRGNLMLLLNDSDRIIYLNTSRDFSPLIGKQVSVSIEGSLDDFRLVDIIVK